MIPVYGSNVNKAKAYSHQGQIHGQTYSRPRPQQQDHGQGQVQGHVTSKQNKLPICIALYYELPISRRSGMARVNEESHSFTSCQPYVYPQVDWTICLYFPAADRHRTFPGTHFRPAEGRRLSWPEWLVSNRDVLSASGRSPIPVLTGPDVE